MKHLWGVSKLLAAGVLTVAQYILAFFIYKLPGVFVLQGIGWGIWALSMIFGLGPIFILKQRGDVPKGRSYVETNQLVTTSLYAIVRHPQYMGIFLFNLALMLLAQHWLVLLLGIMSMFLLYLEIQSADNEALEKFGEQYRSYMQEVPQMNILLGFVRWIARKGAPKP